MQPETHYARNGDASVAHETVGEPTAGEPRLLIMGLDLQLVWWPDAFCQRLVDRGFADTGDRRTGRPAGHSVRRRRHGRRHPWRHLVTSRAWGTTCPSDSGTTSSTSSVSCPGWRMRDQRNGGDRAAHRARLRGSPWQRLYFLPDPQGHIAFRATPSKSWGCSSGTNRRRSTCAGVASSSVGAEYSTAVG